jgi:hypothetical protein
MGTANAAYGDLVGWKCSCGFCWRPLGALPALWREPRHVLRFGAGDAIAGSRTAFGIARMRGIVVRTEPNLVCRKSLGHCGGSFRAWACARFVFGGRHPGQVWPAVSTIKDLPKQTGMVKPVRRRRRPLDQRTNGRSTSKARSAGGTRSILDVDRQPKPLGIHGAPEMIEGARPVFTAGVPQLRSAGGDPMGQWTRSDARGGAGRPIWPRVGQAQAVHRTLFLRQTQPRENDRHGRMHRTDHRGQDADRCVGLFDLKQRVAE